MASTANFNSKDEGVGAQAPILQVQNLSKAFGAMMAVNDLSFEVPAGEVFGIAGPNGAGKTTTIKMIAKILRPNEGKILIRTDHSDLVDLENVKEVGGGVGKK